MNDGNAKGEISLLDLLVLVVENIKLILGGSILAALLAIGLVQIAPKSYTSIAILSLPTPTPAPTLVHLHTVAKSQTPFQAASMMTSPRVLETVAKSWVADGKHSAQLVVDHLQNQVKATPGQDGLLHLETTAATPAQAQNLANAVIDAWLQTTMPAQQSRTELERFRTHAESSLQAARQMMLRLMTQSDQTAGGTPSETFLAAALIAAADLQARYLGETAEINRLLEGYSREVVKQHPTLPTRSNFLSTGLIALLVAMATAMALLLWICLVQAWRSAERDPEVAPKVSRLKALLGLR